MLKFSHDETEPLRQIQFWGIYKRTDKVLAVKIEGPFQVKMSNNVVVTCSDGYLVIDSDDKLCAMPTTEFDRNHSQEA